jgi:hypothetical protein
MDRETEGLSPIEMVARELVISGSNLPQAEIAAALRRVLLLLLERSANSLAIDQHSPEAVEACFEYLAVSEALVAFGSTLKALEDIERHELTRTAGRVTPDFS